MKSILIEKSEFIESKPPKEEKERFDLHAATRNKTLALYNLKDRVQRNFRINKTLYSLARMHCVNENLDMNFLVETALLDFLKRNRIILCRITKKRRMLDPEKRAAHIKRIKQFRKALKEMRGLRRNITQAKPKRASRKLKIESIKEYSRENNQ